MLVGHADINDVRPNEALVFIDPTVWRRWFATLVLLVAVTFAFEPGIVIVLPLIAGVIGVTTLAQGLHIRWAGRWIGITSVALLSGIALNLPWVGTYVRNGWWEALSGAPVESGRNIGLCSALVCMRQLLAHCFWYAEHAQRGHCVEHPSS
jgi:hypothetical protein